MGSAARSQVATTRARAAAPRMRTPEAQALTPSLRYPLASISPAVRVGCAPRTCLRTDGALRTP